ncbi:serine hydrolase domain-containing protein [Phycicoccus flavus]|uniref:serine hydrolase domain-containing protein n=1 Tax=Phycicoccus flavus TaxID=2502783 RepID=UPI000FEB87CF|nr:serine hydrolase [Phycicoccus flavus]NHA69142.1 serine hydrolase [Phycicoccus flavus]
MRVLRRVLLLLVVLAVVAAAAGYRYARPLVHTGTGYAAHNACAVTFVAGRDDADADLPPNPLVPYLTGYDNKAGRSSTAAALWLLAKQKAYYTPGYGCTLAAERPDLGRASEVPSDPNPLSDAPAPETDPDVAAAVARAFGDDLATSAREDLDTRAVVVLRDGKLVAERYAAGFDARTPQLGWSMAKSVTNLLVGRYVRQRNLETDQAGLRPEWTDERRDITVDELMRMTSGLSWDETYALGTPITQMLYAEPDMGAYAASRPLAHQPGTYQQYSSGSTNILCSWLTSLADVPDTDFPRSELFAPLGLSSAVWEPDATGIPVCSSYLWATPRDWAAIGQFALQDGVWNKKRLLPKGWMKTSTTATKVARSEEDGYAAGWWVNTRADGSLVSPDLPADTYWASGHDGQRLYVVPSADLVVVRLGFSPEVGGRDLRTDTLVRDLVGLTAPE